MELVLIRHGQPAWANPDGTSTIDPGLTPLGVQQAQRLARWLTRDGQPPFDQLCTSSLRRARETCAAMEDLLGAEAVVQDWLPEIGSPEAWEGRPEDEVVKEIDAMRRRPREEWWDGAPGGETFRDFHQRVTEGLDGWLAEHGARSHRFDPDHLWDLPEDGPRVALFAHVGTNSVIISHLLGIAPQPWEWERFACDHSGVSVLRSRQIAGGAIWSLEYFSDVAHLAAEQVTA